MTKENINIALDICCNKAKHECLKCLLAPYKIVGVGCNPQFLCFDVNPKCVEALKVVVAKNPTLFPSEVLSDFKIRLKVV